MQRKNIATQMEDQPLPKNNSKLLTKEWLHRPNW